MIAKLVLNRIALLGDILSEKNKLSNTSKEDARKELLEIENLISKIKQETNFEIKPNSSIENIVFLDIDGVINTDWTLFKFRDKVEQMLCSPENHEEQIDPALLNNIKTFCDKTNSKVVISSDWRLLFSIEQIKSFFNISIARSPLPLGGG